MLLWAFNIGEWLRVVEEGGQGMIGVQRQILWHVHPCLIFPTLSQDKHIMWRCQDIATNTSFSNFTMSRAGLVLLAILSWPLLSVVAQGNTTCKGTTLDWYTSVVGETPCALEAYFCVDHVAEPMIGITYQRLRQICNSACM